MATTRPMDKIKEKEKVGFDIVRGEEEGYYGEDCKKVWKKWVICEQVENLYLGVEGKDVKNIF